jgi:hypothetical protein
LPPTIPLTHVTPPIVTNATAIKLPKIRKNSGGAPNPEAVHRNINTVTPTPKNTNPNTLAMIRSPTGIKPTPGL